MTALRRAGKHKPRIIIEPPKPNEFPACYDGWRDILFARNFAPKWPAKTAAERYATRQCGGMGDPHWYALRDAYLAGWRAKRRRK